MEPSLHVKPDGLLAVRVAVVVGRHLFARLDIAERDEPDGSRLEQPVESRVRLVRVVAQRAQAKQ